MLKILRIVLSLLVIAIAGYSLITGNHEIIPYMMFFMGAMLLVTGIAEIKEARKQIGIISIIISIFVFYVAVQGLILN